MTISHSSRTAGPFVGNGITNSFPFSYRVFSPSDLLVAQTVIATGVETLLTIDADYTVNLNADQNSNPGGLIITTVPPPVGTTLAATSDLPIVQTLDLTNNGGFYPRAINDALDKIVINVQQLAARVGLGALNVGAAAQIATVVGFISDVAASAGSSLVGWIQAGMGAIRRTLQDKGRERISVLDFGADATGTNDSADAIAAAIAYARVKANNTGALNQYARSAVIYFPPGQYKVAKKVLLAPNMTFRGDGATILCRNDGVTFETGYYNGSNTLVSNMDLDDVSVTYFGLTGLRFEGLTFYGGDMPLNLRCAIWQSGIFNCHFYDCHIAFTATQCFYATFEDIIVRGENSGFTSAHGIRLMRASNAVTLNNVKVSYRSRGILLGEPGSANTSGAICMTNLRLEVLDYGLELNGGISNLHISDVYTESVSSVFFDVDGALKYNIRIENIFSNSTAYYVDMSGLRDSFIGMVRDHSGLADVKAITRLRQGTYGNQAIVEISNIGDPSTGTNRYQLSNGVITVGVLSKYTSGSYGVMLNQNFANYIVTSQYANQPAIYDTGWYGEVAGYIVGTTDGIFHPVNGTEPYIITKHYFSEYTGIQYAIKITPNAGSGAGGTNVDAIFLKGIVLGRHGTQIGTAGFSVVDVRANSATGTFQISFGEFGINNTDPNFAWMRNGQFTAEGIVKLIA